MSGEDWNDIWDHQGLLELPLWSEGQAGEGEPNHHGMCCTTQRRYNPEWKSPTCAIGGRWCCGPHHGGSPNRSGRQTGHHQPIFWLDLFDLSFLLEGYVSLWLLCNKCCFFIRITMDGNTFVQFYFISSVRPHHRRTVAVSVKVGKNISEAQSILNKENLGNKNSLPSRGHSSRGNLSQAWVFLFPGSFLCCPAPGCFCKAPWHHLVLQPKEMS